MNALSSEDEYLAVTHLQQLLRKHPAIEVIAVELLLPVPMEEIAYFFTLNEVVYLVRHDGRKFPLEPKLEKLGAMLDPAVFFRLNRQ